MAGLKEFVAKQIKPTRCKTCAFPEADEINAGLLEGIGPVQIARWLATKGYDEKEALNAVRSHTNNKHHTQATRNRRLENPGTKASQLSPRKTTRPKRR